LQSKDATWAKPLDAGVEEESSTVGLQGMYMRLNMLFIKTQFFYSLVEGLCELRVMMKYC
jgi:hypothetical protein